MDKEKVKQLAENVNRLIVNFHKQQGNTAKLFEICLEFLEEKKDNAGWGVGRTFAIAEAKKRKERKQQLISAIKRYIEVINEREVKDESQSQ